MWRLPDNQWILYHESTKMNGRPYCTVQNGWLAAFACTFHNGYFNELNSFMTIEVASFDIRSVWLLLYCTAWPNGMSRTVNGEKLRRSPAEPGKAMKSAVA